MRVLPFSHNRLEECDLFWWSIYEHKPYVHRPDGGQTVNTKVIGPGYFSEFLGHGLEGHNYWPDGQVSEDSIFLTEHDDSICGIAVCSIDAIRDAGYVCSAYVPWDELGRHSADLLVEESLSHFRDLGLKTAIAAPRPRGKSMEVESPFHLSLLDAGFAWRTTWLEPLRNGVERVILDSEGGMYGVFLGGSLQGFVVDSAIHEKTRNLGSNGIKIERCPVDRFNSLVGDQSELGNFNCGVTFVAIRDDELVGWIGELAVWDNECGRIGGAVPYVKPEFRNRGIAKVLYHLATEEVVLNGADWGWTATEIHNPARFIYRSIGYRYWYTSYTHWELALVGR